MQLWQIVFWAVYGCLTLTLIALKLFKIGTRKRGVVKMLTSFSFVAAGIWGATQSGGLSVLLCVGLCFASVGDLLWVFRHIQKCFVAGVVFFGLASCVISVYSVLNYGWIWWSAIAYAAFVVFNVLAQKKKLYSYGRNKVVLNCYTLAVGVCGFLGFSLFCRGTAHLPMFLFGLGCFAYFVSDVLLGLHLYKFRNRVVDALNSLCYFPGMLLIATSLWI